MYERAYRLMDDVSIKNMLSAINMMSQAVNNAGGSYVNNLTVMMDFEVKSDQHKYKISQFILQIAMRQEWLASHPNANVKGCMFHFNQVGEGMFCHNSWIYI